MCQAVLDNGAFDPALCPLLQDLSPEEIAKALESDQRIKACISAIGGDSDNLDIVAADGTARADAATRSCCAA